MRTNAEGGCLCGAIRFRTTAQPLEAGYCHCTLCQRSTGAPVLAWASYPVAGFSYTRGVPARYQSSKHGHREFCGNCGTQVAYRDSENAATIEINVGALDEPGSVPPRYHIWFASRVSWFDTTDSLPRFDGPAPKERST